jgi:hypothetical protein
MQKIIKERHKNENALVEGFSSFSMYATIQYLP